MRANRGVIGCAAIAAGIYVSSACPASPADTEFLGPTDFSSRLLDRDCGPFDPSPECGNSRPRFRFNEGRKPAIKKKPPNAAPSKIKKPKPNN